MPVPFKLIFLLGIGIAAVGTSATAQIENNALVGMWRLRPLESEGRNADLISRGDVLFTISSAERDNFRWTMTTGKSGVRHVESYEGAFDGKLRPIIGGVTDSEASFRLVGNSIQAEFSNRGSDPRIENCGLSRDGNKLVCRGIGADDGNGFSKYVRVFGRETVDR